MLLHRLDSVPSPHTSARAARGGVSSRRHDARGGGDRAVPPLLARPARAPAASRQARAAGRDSSRVRAAPAQRVRLRRVVRVLRLAESTLRILRLGSRQDRALRVVEALRGRLLSLLALARCLRRHLGGDLLHHRGRRQTRRGRRGVPLRGRSKARQNRSGGFGSLARTKRTVWLRLDASQASLTIAETTKVVFFARDRARSFVNKGYRLHHTPR